MSRENLEISLCHHGILGQKWGVRRFQNEDGSLTSAGRKRYSTVEGGDSNNSTAANNQSDTSHSTKKSSGSIGVTIAGLTIGAATTALGVISGNPVSMIGGAFTFGAAAVKGARSAVVSARTRAIEKERENEPLDKESGLHKYTNVPDESTMISRVNPDFKNLSSDTKNNCALCSIAMELQHRGYDVGANKADRGYVSKDLFSKLFKNAQTTTVDGSAKTFDDFRDPTFATSQRHKDLVSSTLNLLNQYKPGQRGSLGISWIGGMGAGHSVFFKMTNTGLKIIDAQSGKTYSGSQVESFLNRGCAFQLTRLDNLVANWPEMKEAVH